MARATEEKEPGRFRSLWRVYKMTAKADKKAAPLAILILILPLVIALTLSLIFLRHDVLFIVLWSITGLLIGLMLSMMFMTNRAENYYFNQIEGKPGAVGAILANGLRGSWQSSEMPVAVNPKTQEAVYRAVGRPGIVLIAEGPKDRVERLVKDEQRKVQRILGASKVPVSTLYIGPDSPLKLRKLTREMRRLKNALQRPEVIAVTNRLTSLGGMNMPIPKGIDPRKVRAGRPR